MTKQNIVLIGGGGHCRSAIDVIEQTGIYNIVSILDLREKIGQKVLNYSINGTEDAVDELVAAGNYFAITIGFIKNAYARIKVFDKVKEAGGVLPVIQSANSVRALSAKMGEGSMLFHNAVINSGAVTGVNTIINTGAVVEHDAQIGNHTHISTCSIINGGAVIGNACFIGSGAIVKEGINICDEVIIGAGAVVTKNIEKPGTYIGIPAKIHHYK